MRITRNTYKSQYFQNYERYRELDSAEDLVLERYTYHITDGQKKIAQLDTQTGNSTMYRYQYGNNLGSVGLELNENADTISYEEYYPFGGTSYYAHEYHIDVPKKRYKYCGKEQDEETGMYYYGARYYLPWLCRFASVDPKALEYVHQSSYVFADNNPIVKYDVNGEGTGEGTEPEVQPQNSQNNAKSNFYVLKNDEQAKLDILALPNEGNRNKNYIKIDNEGKVTLDFDGLSSNKIEKLLKNDQGLKLIYDLIHAKKKGSIEDINTLYQTEGNFGFNDCYKEGEAIGDSSKEPPKTWPEHKIGEVNNYKNMKNFSYVASVTTYGYTERKDFLGELKKVPQSTILP